MAFNISFVPNKDRADIEKKEVVINELLMGDIFPILTQVELDGDKPWQHQARDVFMGVMCAMIRIDGKRVNPSILESYPLDFFIEVLKLSFPYIKGSILSQLLNLLNMESVSAKSKD